MVFRFLVFAFVTQWGKRGGKNGINAGMAGRTQELDETDRLTPGAAQA